MPPKAPARDNAQMASTGESHSLDITLASPVTGGINLPAGSEKGEGTSMLDSAIDQRKAKTLNRGDLYVLDQGWNRGTSEGPRACLGHPVSHNVRSKLSYTAHLKGPL